jgi:hypothetical protein
MAENTDAIIKELHLEASRLLAGKCGDEAIVNALKNRGVEEYYAELILQNVKEDKSDRKEFYRHFFGGCFYLVAGVILTIESYRMAVVTGGIYFIFVGIMVYGIYAITRAFLIFKK